MQYLRALDKLRIYWGVTRDAAVRGLVEIVDVGYRAAEAMEILEEAFKLAAVTGNDVAETALLLGSAMGVFGSSALEATRVAESLFYMMSEGRLTLQDLDLGFHRLLVTTKPLGIELQELSAAYTVMSQKTTETYNIYLALMGVLKGCLLYTSPSPRDRQKSRMPSSA